MQLFSWYNVLSPKTNRKVPAGEENLNRKHRVSERLSCGLTDKRTNVADEFGS